MPPVVAVVAAAVIPAAIGVAVGAVTLGAALVSTAVSVGLGLASYALQPKPESPPPDPVDSILVSPNAAPINGARNVPIRQATPPRRFVYGQCRVGGAIFFQDNDNPSLYIATALSDGVIEGVVAVYFGDTLIPVDGSGDAVEGSAYYQKFNLEWDDGADDQTASAVLLAAFPSALTSDFRQRGVARAVVTLDWGDDAQEHSVLWGDSVTPTFLVQGVKVYDPREVSHDVDDPTTWEYSSNPALCVAHALMHAWGVALDPDDIDWDTVADAADVCDTTLTYNRETRKIFELAGVFQAAADIAPQIAEMLSAFGGVIIFNDGKYGIYADEAKTSVWTITDQDIIEFGEFTHAGELRNTWNAIKARYYDADQGGVQVTTPVYEDSTAVAAEGLRETSVELKFTPSSHSAQILAYRTLQRSRDGRTLSLTVSDAGLFVRPFETITLSSAAAPFLNGTYEVIQVDLAQVGCIMQLRGYASAAYDTPSGYLV